MSTIRLINEWIAKFETAILVLIVLTMVFLAGLQIVLRKVFNYGLLWGDIFLRHLVLWVSFIGASLATKDNKHINIDLLSRSLKGRTQSFAHLIIHLFSLFITLLLTNASLNFVLSEKEFGSALFMDIPAWYFQVIIPIGFGLMALRFFLNALLSLDEVIKGGSGDR